MMTLEKLIAAIAPMWALNRARARVSLRMFEAALPSTLRKQTMDRRSPDGTVRQAGEKLRMLARDLDENHDLAKGILNTLVANIIGRGIEIEPIVKTRSGELHADTNSKLIELWQDWAQYPEVTAELHWSSVERLVCRSWLRDGEVLVQKVGGLRSDLDHISRVPFSIELIEADLLPYGIVAPGANTLDGIEKDGWGRPLAYWIYKGHPGDSGSLRATGLDLIRKPAENIIHLKFCDRIRQSRGISIFAPVLTRLQDVRDYEESERIAAKIAASMAAAIKKGTPDIYEIPADAAQRELYFKPGMIFDDLLPGESIETIDAKRPNPNVESFRQGQLKCVAAGTMTGYSTISKSYDASYSAQRQEMVEQSVYYGFLRDHFIERFSRPIWRAFVAAAVASGELRIPLAIDDSTLYSADFRGPSLPWIDPLKEVKAEKEAVLAGFKSRTQVIRERGMNPQDIIQQINAERKKDDSLNLIFDTDYANDRQNTQTGDQGNAVSDSRLSA